MTARLRRFFSQDRSKRRLLLEAAVLMAVVSAGLRWLPFLTVRRVLNRLPPAPAAPTGSPARQRTISSIGWAVGAVAPHLPAATCLAQALAADAMLRRRHLDSAVRFGVRVLNTDARIEGHAWVECEDGMTIGIAEHQSELDVLTSVRRP